MAPLIALNIGTKGIIKAAATETKCANLPLSNQKDVNLELASLSRR